MSHIAISTALPPSFCVLCCKHLIVYGIHISYFVYACPMLRFPDVETNPGPRRPVPLSADYSVVMCGAWPGTLVTWPWRCLSMTYCFVQRLWSLIRVTCRSCWFPHFVALSCCAEEGCLGPEGWRHTYEMDMEHFANPSLSVVVAKCCFLRFVVWDRTYVFSLSATLT